MDRMTGSANANSNDKQNSNDMMEMAFAIAALHPLYRNMKGSIDQKITPVLEVAYWMIKYR